jgi:MFS family permease
VDRAALAARRRALAVLAVAIVLSMTTWFSASAVLPQLRDQWDLSRSAAAWLTIAVQLGFVGGAIVSSAANLADVLPPRLVIAAGSVGATLANALLLGADGPRTAIPLRLATGFFLAGVYPPALKLMATWYRTGRGVALGVLVGALTVGSAAPHLVNGLGGASVDAVIVTTSLLTLAGGVLVLVAMREGPYAFPPATFDPRQSRLVFANRGVRLASLGYFGHMWELYALWTWLSVFVLAGQQERGHAAATSTGVIAFSAIGIAGLAGSLLGGWASDRFGRRPAAVTALVISGACCIASPLFFAAPTVVLVLFLLVWGASVIADSGVFSTSLSEIADKRLVGTALAAQTAIGFLLTVVTIHLVPVAAGLVGWRYAFLLLAPGPVIGAVAMAAIPEFPTSITAHEEKAHDDHFPELLRSPPQAGGAPSPPDQRDTHDSACRSGR